MTTGILDAAMGLRSQGGRPIDTPHLKIAYEPKDFRAFREMGKTWEILTDETPQPPGLDHLPD